MARRDPVERVLADLQRRLAIGSSVRRNFAFELVAVPSGFAFSILDSLCDVELYYGQIRQRLDSVFLQASNVLDEPKIPKQVGPDLLDSWTLKSKTTTQWLQQRFSMKKQFNTKKPFETLVLVERAVCRQQLHCRGSPCPLFHAVRCVSCSAWSKHPKSS